MNRSSKRFLRLGEFQKGCDKRIDIIIITIIYLFFSFVCSFFFLHNYKKRKKELDKGKMNSNCSERQTS